MSVYIKNQRALSISSRWWLYRESPLAKVQRRRNCNMLRPKGNILLWPPTPQGSWIIEDEKENIVQEPTVVDAYREAWPSAPSRALVHINLEQLWPHVQYLCKTGPVASREKGIGYNFIQALKLLTLGSCSEREKQFFLRVQPLVHWPVSCSRLYMNEFYKVINNNNNKKQWTLS